MKNGKRPTRKQKVMIQSHGLNLSDWLVERETTDKLVVIHRYTDTLKTIWKGA